MTRLLDSLAAMLALLALAPFFLIIAIAIKLDSPGPVIFQQIRLGKNKKPFSIIKFRTMVTRQVNDQRIEAVVEGASDMRITRVGRLLRATSIDELPQLINVLKGEMNLVGPRPILPEQLQVVPPHLWSRFDVNPGITGLAQVSGRRSLDWMQQLEYDKVYAENHSIIQDLHIIFRTLHVVIKGSGVYAEAGKNWRAHLNSDSDVASTTGVISHVSNTTHDDHK